MTTIAKDEMFCNCLGANGVAGNGTLIVDGISESQHRDLWPKCSSNSRVCNDGGGGSLQRRRVGVGRREFQGGRYGKRKQESEGLYVGICFCQGGCTSLLVSDVGIAV